MALFRALLLARSRILLHVLRGAWILAPRVVAATAVPTTAAAAVSAATLAVLVTNDLSRNILYEYPHILREEFYRDPMREARTIFSHRTRVPFPRFVPIRFIVASLGGTNSSR